MKQSILFTKTKKETIKEDSRNAQLLLRGGFINKDMAGVYTYLPLGFRVLKKIEEVIRVEMEETMEAQEVLMSALHSIDNYRKTGREEIDVLFHTELSSGGELVLGQSHEEVIVPLLRGFLNSYRDLPIGIYQIQTKFRNELRAKSGILRGREFLMKDLYSFHSNEEDFKDYYERAKNAYLNIFNKVGLGECTYFTFADGGTFSKYSHEFQTVTDAGEDIIYLCRKCSVAINKEIIEEQSSCPQCGGKDLEKLKSIEVGNIFPLGTRFSKAFELTYKDNSGKDNYPIMGCYGIGVSRLMGSVVEVLSDEKGIVWPEVIAPFRVHLISIGEDEKATEIYEKLLKEGIEVLFDDRDKGAGEKFADADLIGVPFRVVVSGKTLKEDSVEIKKRNKEESNLVKIEKFISYVK